MTSDKFTWNQLLVCQESRAHGYRRCPALWKILLGKKHTNHYTVWATVSIKLSKRRVFSLFCFLGDLGESIRWCPMNLQGDQSWEILSSDTFISSCLTGRVSVISHFPSSSSWWSSKVRSEYLWAVCLRTFDWQAAELLFAKQAAAVCLACAKTLCVDHFPGILA